MFRIRERPLGRSRLAYGCPFDRHLDLSGFDRQGQPLSGANFEAQFDRVLDVCHRLVLRLSLADAARNRRTFGDPDTVLISIERYGEFHTSHLSRESAIPPNTAETRGLYSYPRVSAVAVIDFRTRLAGSPAGRDIRYDTAPATRLLSSFFSLISVISTSVVRASAAMLAALDKAVLATLAGSMMPNLNMSPYSSVAAL
jgi:hypothetical protein